MSKEKSGDLLVTAAEGYDLAKDYEAVVSNYKGGHGDAGSDIILVPYIYYEPNKPASRATFMRAEQLGIKFKAYLLAKRSVAHDQSVGIFPRVKLCQIVFFDLGDQFWA